MLLRLMSFYQVMPPYLDFLYAYGSSHGQDKELHFSGFKTEKTLTNPVAGSDVPELGRSGRKYQMCYNLKTAAPKQDNNWKIRQAAVHHQFDVGKGTQLWIVADPHAEIKERVGELYRDNHAYPTSFSTMEQGFKSSMDVHFIYAQWATTNWRWNLRFLEENADQLTLVTSMVNEESQMQALDPGSLGGVQRWEEKVNSTLMAMESNVKIMKLIQKFYKDLVKDEHFPQRERRACQSAVKDFVFQLEELICETQMQVSRAQVLLKILSDRKTILIQHLQARTALISSKLTAVMYKQAERSAMEAIAVRIVTIVTLIYLPATFSSTFFSTDVVKYQGGEMFDQTALDRFLQVTLPLMFLTFVPAGSWFWYERRNINKKSKQTEGQFNDLFTHEKDITNLK
ncbi:hypothetical protein CGCSCA4_v009097 [Colletotrichum siamense]|uniref:CorA-like transporter domain-containing protein n=1 Tax=Colletotrichum siamense TaxID=690259 RepID=A0A9P5BRP2_COLSI|nr:hypothetical protein CGCSCA4_v009097 [Colletotrichum siamense]KAF4847165.1 hypothetical protein CGCSCA2_v012836 [Colletotrichum siamense]